MLNDELLPTEYFAEVQVHVGSRVEVDVGTFADASAGVAHAQRSGTAAATLVARPWAPPAPAMTMPTVFPDSIEVLVFRTEAGPTLVAAIELVSPGNKDRQEHRRAFAAKCSSYLQQGIGLMLIDIVTSRQANLHNELVYLLDAGEQFLLPLEPLYATAYHRCVVKTLQRSQCGRPRLPLAGHYHCCRCHWTKPFLCRLILE